MRVLVTGGAGFIGSHVAQALIERGERVDVLDNFDPFYDPLLKEHNLERLRETGDFSLIRADLRDTEALRGLFESSPPEAD